MKTKRLLVLGTTSDAGKSSVVAALCRIFSKKWSVSPFKAQNMSLNSWISPEGKEISFAQVIQAWAAGVDPIPEMNPVLLKPTGDRKSQVIILGEHFANKEAGNYYNSINEVNEILKRSLEKLEEMSDLIIMEGAGGAAEINLYDRDIVNIGTAKLTNAPIILVGDIERGGVFASLYGTVMLLPDDVRKNVKGFVINKFRGDPKILENGLEMIEEITGIPVLGVIPYFKIKLPDEDSMSFKNKTKKYEADKINITVIKLPKISHFTDFEVLEQTANVVYASIDEKIEKSDLIIIPATSAPVDALKAIYKTGMAKQIKDMKGICPIIGIGEGFHLMGEKITNETGTKKEEYDGLGLLNLNTVYSKDEYVQKPTRVKLNVKGFGPILKNIDGEQIEGFKVGTGSVKISNDLVKIFGEDSCCDPSGLIIGTSIHELFNNKNVRTSLLKYLCDNKNIMYDEKEIITKDEAFDELAEIFEKNANMELIEKIIMGSDNN